MDGRTPRGGLDGLRRRVAADAAVVVALTVCLGVASVMWDLPIGFTEWGHRHSLPVDHLVLLLAGSHLLMIVFGGRRGRELKAAFARRQAAEDELRHRARHDALTGLLNRAGLMHELAAALDRSATGEGPVSVALLDLDRFKEVNDTLGHPVGDRLLQAVGGRLRGDLRDDIVLARLGGDEFVLVLSGLDAAAVAAVTERALEALRRPFEVDGFVLEIDGSLGVATTGGGTSGETAGVAAGLLRAADVAMYAAKAEHGGVVLHTPQLDRHDREHLALFGDLRRGIRDGQLLVHYQPKAALPDGRVLGMEALVRWEHPRHGLLLPAAFIELAEHTGLIRPLTDAVLGLALTDLWRWRADGLELTVAVNLSARSLLDLTLPDRLGELLIQHALPADCLELEITEGATMQDPARALEVLRLLRRLGVRLSVDDYGTGHASLSYLSRLPVSTLKIDRSFVSAMENSANDQTIVRSTIDLAHSLGLRVVAEGVETRQTWEQLQSLGCDEAQGFWLARPSPAHEVPAAIQAIEQLIAGSAPADVVGHR